jgi:flagellar biosynthesis protein FlhG
MQDQANELRQLVREQAGISSAAQPAAPLVIVSGGKGGVGTTTVAANLAIALARQGRRAVFVDADLDHGGHVQLASCEGHGSVVDVLAGRRGVHEVLERGPAGIQVLSGAWASGEVCEFSAGAHDRFVAELERLAPHAEVVVVDAGSSRSRFAQRLWQAATAVVVVTTTDASAIMSSYAAIKTLGRDEGERAIYTLVNLADDATESAQVLDRIAAACRKFLAVSARSAGGVSTLCEQGDPGGALIYPPKSDPARALDRLADTLWAQLNLEAAGGRRQAIGKGQDKYSKSIRT